MPYTVEETVPGQVMLAEIYGEVTWEDFENSCNEQMRLMENSDHDLMHIIAKMDRAESHPTSLGRLNSIFKPLMTHPKYGWLVVIGMNNRLTIFLTTTLAKIFKIRYHTEDSVEDAIAFLKRVDATLTEATTQ